MIVGIIRKSPGSKEPEKSIDRQKEYILNMRKPLGLKDQGVRWIIDICEGDEPGKRKEFLAWINDEVQMEATTHALCESVDRWFRSWHGLMYFHNHLRPNKVQLHLGGVPNMYDTTGELQIDPVFYFELQHVFSYYWLMRIRDGRRKGIDRILKGDPETRKKKYPGRPRPRGTR